MGFSLLGHAAIHGQYQIMKELARHKICDPQRAWVTLQRNDWDIDTIIQRLVQAAKGNLKEQDMKSVFQECIELYLK